MINIDDGYYNFFLFSINIYFSFFNSETMCRLYTGGENNTVLSSYNSIVIVVGTIFFFFVHWLCFGHGQPIGRFAGDKR